MMQLYSLTVNGETLVEIEMDVPAWLPVRPRLDRRWLRSIIAEALQRYFSSRVVRA